MSGANIAAAVLLIEVVDPDASRRGGIDGGLIGTLVVYGAPAAATTARTSSRAVPDAREPDSS